MQLFERILANRGLTAKQQAAFLLPDYSIQHDPFLLPDMAKAVDRIEKAFNNQEKIVIYGDYDIDGLTATALILDAFNCFGFENVISVIPSRFTDGYGLTIDAVEEIAKNKSDLIITVDCGSQSEKEIIQANELGVDVIVTDHHNIAEVQPPAIAVINPKRSENKYPFVDLAGVGVAFNLVRAMQRKLKGLPEGQEKWLLDLVALGTVCDIVPLLDENRTNVFWGLKVLAKSKRMGLKALMRVADVNPSKITAKTLGYIIGPRMNAAGRLETAQFALDMLITTDSSVAAEEAKRLDEMNILRRIDQSKITKEAIILAEKYNNDKVLVVSDLGWNFGIVGIVASKLLEKFKKPVFVLQELGDEAKGSARSYGDFNVADAVNYCKKIIATSGGGHKLAAGVTLPTKNIDEFRKKVNEFYKKQKLIDQALLLLPSADTNAELSELTEEVVDLIGQLEPFGMGNPEPILRTDNLIVKSIRRMGADSQHVKLDLQDVSGKVVQFVAFNAVDQFFVKPGQVVNVWYYLETNEWQGRRTVEGRMLHLEIIN